MRPHREQALPYLDLLRAELDLVARHLKSRRRVAQLHLGGGTPTYFSPSELEGLMGALLAVFELDADAEVAVEVDPRVTTEEHIDVLARLGFNRLSLGVQDLTPRVQEAINRVQSYEETRSIVERARERGFKGLNVDLIYGLPHQTPSSFEKTVESVIGLGFDRAAVYSFALVPWIRGQQKRISEEDLPPRQTKLELFALARELFLAAGYEPIGMDHFALPGDELARAKRRGALKRNFQGYTVLPSPDVVGLGISAIGDVGGAYVQNHKKLSLYEKDLRAGRLPVSRGVVRSSDDDVRREVVQGLLCNLRVDVAEIERRFGISFADYFAEDLERLSRHAANGFVEIGEREIVATPLGELFVRNLAMCFDLYWRQKHEGSDRRTFSRTV